MLAFPRGNCFVRQDECMGHCSGDSVYVQNLAFAYSFDMVAIELNSCPAKLSRPVRVFNSIDGLFQYESDALRLLYK